jgi:hypothetical protein
MVACEISGVERGGRARAGAQLAMAAHAERIVVAVGGLDPLVVAVDLVRKFEELERRLRAAEARVTSSEFKLRRQFRDLES